MAPVLRPYQVEAIDRLRALIMSGRQRILFVLATGGGKTVCFASIVVGAIAKGSRVLILAHRRELIDQAVSKLLAAGIPEREVGVIMASDRRRRPGAAVQVASVDTLRGRAKPPADIVIVDEAHRAMAATYRGIAAAYPDAVHLGFTATPIRGDGKGLGDEYEDIVIAVPISQLIAEGHLVAPHVWTVPASSLPDLRGVKSTAGDYNQKQLAAACTSGALMGDIVDHWVRRGGGHRTVGFAASVEHSQQLVARFRERGIAAEHLDGETPADDRKAILARLDRGDTRVVWNVGVLCEGWDQPSCKTLILARPTQSLGLYLQMAGRILRPWEGVEATILDHAGCARMHGLPHEDRDWSLEPTRKKRGKGDTDCAKLCDECLAVVPLGARICPECGAELPWREQDLTEGDGELEEVLQVSVRQIDEWNALVAEWRAENDRRMNDPNGRPQKPGVLFHRWKAAHGGRPPPRGSKRPTLTGEEQDRLDAWERRQAERETATTREIVLERMRHLDASSYRPTIPGLPSAPMTRKAVSW